MIRAHSAAEVSRTRAAPPQLHSFLDACDKERARSLEDVQTLEIHISPIHHAEGAGLGQELVEDVDVVDFSGEISINAGMEPQASSRVCIFTAALRERKRAHGNTDRQRSMVVESRA